MDHLSFKLSQLAGCCDCCLLWLDVDTSFSICTVPWCDITCLNLYISRADEAWIIHYQLLSTTIRFTKQSYCYQDESYEDIQESSQENPWQKVFSDRQWEKIQESLRADSSLESKNGRDAAQIHKGKKGQPSLLPQQSSFASCCHRRDEKHELRLRSSQGRSSCWFTTRAVWRRSWNRHRRYVRLRDGLKTKPPKRLFSEPHIFFEKKL